MIIINYKAAKGQVSGDSFYYREGSWCSAAAYAESEIHWEVQSVLKTCQLFTPGFQAPSCFLQHNLHIYEAIWLMWVQNDHHYLKSGIFFSCSVHLLSIWKTFVQSPITVHAFCTNPDKANSVPLACAFEWWAGGKKSIMQQFSLWDAVACCRRCMWNG